MSGLVSIIAPCYNGQEYISNFLNSILYQTYNNIELIIVDDGSIDNSKEIIYKYISLFEQKKMKIIYLYQQNKGQAAAINLGLKYFSGEYLMWMDSDDILYKDAIFKKKEYLDNNLDKDFVLCNGDIVDINNVNKIIGTMKRIVNLKNDNLFSDLIDEKNVIFCPATFFVRSNSFAKVFTNKKIYESREGQNWQLMLPLAYTLKWGYIEESLFKYVVRNDSHSHLKRDYLQLITRRDNFIDLQKKTLLTINDMSNDEREFWNKRIIINQTKKKLELTLKYGKKKDFNKFKNILEIYNINIKNGYYMSRFSFVLKKIVRKCRLINDKN